MWNTRPSLAWSEPLEFTEILTVVEAFAFFTSFLVKYESKGHVPYVIIVGKSRAFQKPLSLFFNDFVYVSEGGSFIFPPSTSIWLLLNNVLTDLSGCHRNTPTDWQHNVDASGCVQLSCEMPSVFRSKR